MPTFKHTVIGTGPICDAECTIIFSNRYVEFFAPDNTTILTGWRETAGAKIWRFSLLPYVSQLPLAQPDTENFLIFAYSAYDLPSVEAFVRYLHAAANFHVKSTCLKVIKAGNFVTWPCLTYSNSAKYYPESSETANAHIVQSRNNVRLTNPSKVTSPTIPMVAK